MRTGRKAWAAGLLTGMLLAGCQHYAPLPLAPAAALAPALPAAVPSAAPLSVDDVVRLALDNNPDLKAARAKRGIARAELIQSGLLPNPSIALSFLPLISGDGVAPAWSAGLTQDLKAILTYRSKRRAGKDSAGAADADLLWQEWQTAGQARQLAVDLIGARRSRPLTEEAFDVLGRRRAATEQALAAGNTTIVIAAPTRTAFQAARARLDALDQKEMALRHQLNALLGLAPDVVVPLAATADLPPFDPQAVRASLGSLPDRRPDLLALRLGYAAREEAVRQSILTQFPDLVLGGSVTRDSSKVLNAGPGATIGLPVFDRGQGAIASARATRAQLHAEYDARLAAATGEVGATLAEMEQLGRQLAVAKADLPAARLGAARAIAARGRSAIDEAAVIALIDTRYTKEEEVMGLELALMDRQVALQTLIGAGLPTVDTLPVAGAAR